jgi:hypothetical protein
MGFDLGHFLNDAGKAIGKAADGIVHAIGDTMAWPFTVANEIAKGQRLDRAFMKGFKQAIGAAKELAPYVQAVISFVPGIGTVCGAAIGGGIALAEGKPIDEVLAGAVAGAIPGGVFVKDAYEIGKAAVEKKPILAAIEQGVLDMAGNLGAVIPDSAKDLLVHGLGMAQDTIRGVDVAIDDVKKAVDMIPNPVKKAAIQEALKPGSKINVADIVIDSALDQVPGIDNTAKTSIKHGLAIGMAMSHGKNLQEGMKKDAVSPDATHKLAQNAATIVSKDPVVAAARANLAGQGTQGFDLGIALAHRPGTTQTQLLAIRNSLGPQSNVQGTVQIGADHGHHRSFRNRGREPLHHHKWSNDQLAFDTALALHIGRRIAPPPVELSYRARAAHGIALGLRYAPEHIKTPVLHTINDSGSTPGVALAHAQTVNEPFVVTLGSGIAGLIFFGPVGLAVGAGLGYMLASGGFFKEHS